MEVNPFAYKPRGCHFAYSVTVKVRVRLLAGQIGAQQQAQNLYRSLNGIVYPVHWVKSVHSVKQYGKL